MDAPLPDGLVAEIERVIATDKEPGGRNVYDAVFDSGLMFPLQRKRELDVMIQLARSVDPRVVMEIGTDKAGGAYHWLKALDLDLFIGVEIRGVPYAKLLSESFYASQLWYAASSYDRETVESIRDVLLSEAYLIDVLFIDGDKANFYKDFTTYIDMVQKGGIVFMHDIQDEAPRRGFEQARKHPRVRRSETIVDTSEVDVALARESQGLPPASAHEGWLRHWRGRSCGVGVLWC